MPGHDHDAEQTHAVEPAAVEAVAAPAVTPAGRMLERQQTMGNRAVARLVARTRTEGASERVLARRPTQVRTYQSDGPYGISGAFEVEFDGIYINLTIRARVVPDASVTTDDADRVKAETREAFLRFWDEKFIFDDEVNHDHLFLRVNVVFVDRGGHTRIRLKQNRRNPDGTIIEGRDDQTTWFVHSNPIDRAHELSHQLGLRDEYIDAEVRRRRNASAPGVFQDHSIMGNYYDEGIGQAEVKLRHGQELARYIGLATRRRFRVSLTGTFQGERLVRWREISAAAAAGSTERAAADAEIAAIESDMMIPQLRALVGAP